MKYKNIFGSTTDIKWTPIKPPLIKRLERSRDLLQIISDMNSSGEIELAKTAISALVIDLNKFYDELSEK